MGKFVLRPIHLSLFLAVLLHIVIIYGVLALAGGANTPAADELRIVTARVEVVDKVQMPQVPQPVIKSVTKSLVKNDKVLPSTVVNSKNPNAAAGKKGAPGAPGKIGAPGKPGRPGRPGSSGRAGLRTAIDPNTPDVGAGMFDANGYPTGHGYGYGNKKGKGSGFGPDGDGGDGGEGGQGGEGGGGGEGGEGGGGGEVLGNIVFTATDHCFISPNPFEYRVYPKVVMTFVNNSSRTLTLRVDGQSKGADDINGDLYGGWWVNVKPGESRSSSQIHIEYGSYNISILDAEGYNLRDGSGNEVFGRMILKR